MSNEFFVFRLNKLKIINNREFLRGEAKLISFVTPEDRMLPILDDFKKTNVDAEKKNILKTAARSILATKELMKIENIIDGHQMTFGDTGYALYQANKIPLAFNWSLLIMESDDDVRNVGTQIDETVNHPEFDNFTSNLLILLGAAGNPAAAAGAAITKFVFKIIGNTMQKNKDDQLGILYQSFNRFQHYPHGERKKDNVPDLTNNILIDYSIFGTAY